MIGQSRPMKADGFRSPSRRLFGLLGREQGGMGEIGRTSGGNLPLDTSYSGEVQSLVDLEA